MKKTIRGLLILMMTAVVLTSCSSDDKNPPTAGFTLSETNPVQWDKVTISNQASDATTVTYSVTGGNYELATDNTSVVFLEEGNFTVTQSVSNSDGTDTSSVSVTVDSPDNMYTLDGTDLPVKDNAFWYDASAMGGTVYIRMLGDVAGQDNPNLIKLYPVSGPNPIESTYTWSDSGDIGTYDAGMTANYAGFSYDWTTNGDSGQDLKIELVYEDPNSSDDNIYDITLTSYTLNYGNWDFSIPAFVSDGTKTLSLYYRGKIDPVK